MRNMSVGCVERLPRNANTYTTEKGLLSDLPVGHIRTVSMTRTNLLFFYYFGFYQSSVEIFLIS
jgi:hypothetical protein